MVGFKIKRILKESEEGDLLKVREFVGCDLMFVINKQVNKLRLQPNRDCSLSSMEKMQRE